MLAELLSVLIVGCVEPIEVKDPEATACGVAAEASLNPDVPTFADVTWDEPGLTEVSVAFWEAGRDERVVPVDDGGAATVRFLGAGTDWKLRVRGTLEGRACESEALHLRTPPAPAELPPLVVTQASDDPAGDLVLTAIQGERYAAVVIDRDGRYAWWRVLDDGESAERVRATADGESVWVLGLFGQTQNGLTRIGWDGSITETISADHVHHDVAEVRAGGDRIAWLSQDTRPFEDVIAVGDTIDVLSDDGSIRRLWSAFDWYDIAPNAGWNEPLGENQVDWTHANSLEYLPDLDAFLISLRFLPAVALVSRADGRLLWTFGEGAGFTGDFALQGTPPGEMHSASRTANGLMIFENGDTATRHSLVREFAIDWTARTAQELWTSELSEESYTFVRGDADRLTNGRTLTNWGNLGVLAEFDAAQTLSWKVNLSVGGLFGFQDILAAPWEAGDAGD